MPVMSTAIGGHSSQEENESAFLAGIGRVAAAADAAGVDVALEIHGDIMATGALTLPLLEKIGHPRIKVAYDTANCEFYGDTKAVDDLHTMLPYLANVHLKDKRGGKGVWDFPEPGAGHVDFAGILAILRDGGYDGPAVGRDRVRRHAGPTLAGIDASHEGRPRPPRGLRLRCG